MVAVATLSVDVDTNGRVDSNGSLFFRGVGSLDAFTKLWPGRMLLRIRHQLTTFTPTECTKPIRPPTHTYIHQDKLRVCNENLFLKFLFLNQNICCGYSKEPSQ